MKLNIFFASSVISMALSSAFGNRIDGIYADKIQIQSTTGEQLQFFEVQAFSSNTNVTVQGTSSQSSTFQNDGRFAASMANDEHDWTFSHTDDPNPSWELELDEAVPLERITILNRYCRSREDSPGCLVCRLSFATVSLFLENEVVSTRSLDNTCGVTVVTELCLETSAPIPPSLASAFPSASSANPPPSASPTSSPISLSPTSASPSRLFIGSFSSMDVGTVGLRGSATSKFTVTGSGGDIWGSSDQFHYYYQEVPSDANIRIEMLVEDLTSDQHAWTKGGLMLRNNLDNDSIHYSAFATGRMGLANQWRPCTGCNSNHNGLQDFSDRKVWLRIDKFNSNLEAYYRQLNESEWTRFGLTALNFSGTSYYVGVAVSSHDNSRTASLDGSNLKITTISDRVPTDFPTASPTYVPTEYAGYFPTQFPAEPPSGSPTYVPTEYAGYFPTQFPAEPPSGSPTYVPTEYAGYFPTQFPAESPSGLPTYAPTEYAGYFPTQFLAESRSGLPTYAPTEYAGYFPTQFPAESPSGLPTYAPTEYAGYFQTQFPAESPSGLPTYV